MNEILPGLFLGGIFALEEGSQIVSNKIDAIVTVGEFSCEFHKPHLKYLDKIRINIRDNKEANILPHILTVNNFIHKNRLEKKNVFVHCFGGVSRSVTLITSYLMSVTDLEFETALNYVKTKRRGAQPNEGFLLQLETFESEMVQYERQRIREEFINHSNFMNLYEKDIDFIGYKNTKFFEEKLKYQLGLVDFQQLSV